MVTKIIDRGCGVDLKKLKNIFTTFAFDNSKNQTHGIGIGLNTAWVLSEALGGSINLKNNGEQAGTTVTFKIALTSLRGISSFHEDIDYLNRCSRD